MSLDLREKPNALASPLSHIDRLLVKDPREDKLPRWAQQRLDYLRSAVREKQDELLTMKRAVGATNVFVAGGPRDEDLPLPKYSKIRFQIGEGTARLSDIIVCHTWEGQQQDPRSLEIQASGRSVSIEPGASNSFRVRLR